MLPDRRERADTIPGVVFFLFKLAFLIEFLFPIGNVILCTTEKS
jgi:hypothetical protein